MRKNYIKIEKLTLAAYSQFGSFSNLINPNTEKIGASPVEFFRDQLQTPTTSNQNWSYSCCKVEKRPLVIDTLEFHSYTGEIVLPLDNDILLQVAPATANISDIPLEKIRVFFIPKGTSVSIKPGVWHWAPFTANDKPVNILINLPERTYANDCKVVQLDQEDQISIDIKSL